MTQNAQNVFVAAPPVGGAIWSAPAGTPVPTDAVTPLDEAFKSLGFISEDGIVNAEETDFEEIKAYGGATVKKKQTSRDETFTFTPIETNAVVLAEQYGDDNVTVDAKGNIAIAHNAKEKPSRVYVVETVLDGSKVHRDVVPCGRVTEVGDKTYADGKPLAREMSVTCEQDADGNTAYTYIATVEGE